MLAVDHCLQKWCGYVKGSPIMVRTDHESLKYFLTQKHLIRCLACLADRISQFNIQIRYCPGSHQLAADALSRHDGLPEISDTETQGPLPALPMENSNNNSMEIDRSAQFATLHQWKEDLRQNPNAEPSQRGFMYHDGQLYRVTDLGDRDVYLCVPTSLDDTFMAICNVHIEIGHLST